MFFSWRRAIAHRGVFHNTVFPSRSEGRGRHAESKHRESAHGLFFLIAGGLCLHGREIEVRTGCESRFGILSYFFIEKEQGMMLA